MTKIDPYKVFVTDSYKVPVPDYSKLYHVDGKEAYCKATCSKSEDVLSMMFNEGDYVMIKNTYDEHKRYPLIRPLYLSDIYKVYATYYVESDHKFFEERQMTVIPIDYVEGKPRWKDQEQSKWISVPADVMEVLRGAIKGKELGII